MTRAQLQITAIILSVITASIHLLLGAFNLGNPAMWPLNGLWIANGLGTIYLMMASFARAYIPFPFKRSIAPWVLLGYTVLTILAWVVITVLQNGDPIGVLALVTKLVEVLLIVAIIMRQRALAATA